MYKISVKKSALKELESIPKSDRSRIIAHIDALANNPRPQGVRKLENYESSYRIRIGNYRVIYSIEDEKLLIEVIKVADRKEAYKK